MFPFLMVILNSPMAHADGCAPTDPSHAADAVLAYEFQADRLTALNLVSTAEGGLACADALLAPSGLWLLYQAGAFVAHQAKDDDRAEALLETGVRLVGDLPLDNRMQGGLAPLLPATRAALQGRGSGTFHARSLIWLDGQPLPAGSDRRAGAGWHLVQVIDSAGRVQTERMDLAAGATQDVGVAPPPPPTPLPLPVAPVPVAEPRVHGWRLALGGAVAAAGAGALFYGVTEFGQAGVNRQDGRYTDEEIARETGLARAWATCGGVGLGLGAVWLGTGLPLSEQSVLFPVLSGRW